MQAITARQGTMLTLGSYADLHPVAVAFERAVRKVDAEWPEFLVQDDEANYVRNFVRDFGRDPNILLDYERYGLGFNKAFFFKNLYKALVVLWERRLDLAPFSDSQIIDVGCGAGVFSIAWTLIFGSPPRGGLVLIDSSEMQLSIAARILAILGIADYDLRRGTYPGEFADLRGFRLYSYFYCKQKLEPTLLNRNEVAGWLGVDALVIDYSHVLESLVELVGHRYQIQYACEALVPPSTYSRLFNDTSFKACGLICHQKPFPGAPVDTSL